MTTGTLVTRAAPLALLGATRARYVLERNLLVYRRSWVIILSGFFEPVLFLFSVGWGVGALVGDVVGPGGVEVDYTTFLAPALLAASAMNGAVFESTFNIFFKLKFGRIYEAMLATPLQTRDIALGELAWTQIRGGLYAAAFLGVMLVGGWMPSLLGLLALPAALLIGFAFGAVGFAATSYMRSWQDFDLVQLVTVPLFLFSGTFFPLDTYPAWFQPVVQLSPLYHGAELIRGLTLGVLRPGLLGHVTFLLGMGVVGITVADRRLGKLLTA